MKNHSFDISELASASTAVSQVARTSVADIAAAAVSIAAGAGSWGDDAIGQAFAAKYLTAASQSMSALVQTAYHVGEIGTLLGETGQQYRDVEDTNQAASTSVDRELRA